MNSPELDLTKADLAILERAFAAEVSNHLPFQSKSKRAAALVENGYLQPMEETIGGRFQVRISGFQLTHLGRITYCATC